MIIKLGENLNILRVENTSACIAEVNPEILNDFKKTAQQLKIIAPKAEDFLYFSAIMMHAAEASALNNDGTPKLTAKGEPVKVGWDKSGGTWKWESNDKKIKPYKNANGDIFPEEELVKAYKKWKDKPLCIDHKSSSVDHVRGFIVDTYYDRDLKRVVALCALDKKNYPELARKVETGVSHSVSMGTAVGKAICTEDGCHKVARVESDFCNHMKTRSCYGEINVDLNPIELSIVVTGADPQAHIKHIIASVNTLNTYVEEKEKELNKLAQTYSVNINGGTEPGKENAKSINLNFSASNIEQLKEEIAQSFEKLHEFEKDLAKDSNDVASMTGSSSDISENQENSGTESLSPPHQRFANDDIKDFNKIAHSINDTLLKMQDKLDRLSKNIKQEENMSVKKAYYQGTEEPTPGKPQYEKDPLNDQVREKEGKQFDESDTGPVDGMHPGVKDSGMSEVERKKMLLRAEEERSALRRQAIVAAAKKNLQDKKAYHLGTEEPAAPGKTQYTPDPLNQKVRESEGTKPNTNDEKSEIKEKEKLSRAGLKARFVRSHNDPLDSSWNIFADSKLILSASVKDLCGDNADLMLSTVATSDFGKGLIEKVKRAGVNSVKLFKKAQEMTPPPAPAPAPTQEAAPTDLAPPTDVAATPAAEGDLNDQMKDTGANGSPEDTISDLTSQLTDLSSDLSEAASKLKEEKADMPLEPQGSSEKVAQLQNLRVELNDSLDSALTETSASLKEHIDELQTIASILSKGGMDSSNKAFVTNIIDEAVSDAKTALASGYRLMTSFVKYARGAQNLVKRASMEDEMSKLDETTSTSETNEITDEELAALLEDDTSSDPSLDDTVVDDSDLSLDDNDLVAKPDELKNLTVAPGTKIEVSASTREGRDALRNKLASEMLSGEDLMNKAHPKGSYKLEVPAADGLNVVEDVEDTHEAMMDLVNAPVKVRKEAQNIHQLVTRGELDESDLDSLVAEGLDKDAVAYYKKFYSQTDGGSEFASELVKEHAKAELDKEIDRQKVKLARAYELAHDMVARGMCPSDRNAVTAQVEELMGFDDHSFDSLKKVVYRNPVKKEASLNNLPNIGTSGAVDMHSNTGSPATLAEQLAVALNSTRRKNF